MERRQGSKSLLRGLAVIAAMLLAAAAISPAFSAAPLTRKGVKTIAKKQIPKSGNPLFIQESELERYGPINLNLGQAAPIGEFGSFTFTAHCDEVDSDGDGPPLDERGRVLIQSGENDSAFESDDDFDDDFDAGEVGFWEEEIAEDPGMPDLGSEDEGDAHASAPSGPRVAATSNLVTVNHAGFDCTFSGSILVLP